VELLERVLEGLNLRALGGCAELSERCVKSVARCEREVRLCDWRADLRCGGIYVEIEPAERLACGLGQAALWRAACGVDAVLLVYGSGESEKARLASLIVPTVYIDVKLKIACKYAGGAGNCIPVG
jgi:hypothetical protein